MAFLCAFGKVANSGISAAFGKYKKTSVLLSAVRLSKNSTMTDSAATEKVVIIGSGPAAHAAAIYTGRAELSPLVFEGFLATGIAAGGQLTTTTEVENFPGFPEGITGPELMERMKAQSEKCGARIKTETIDSVDLSRRPFRVTTEGGESISTQSLIIATGATAKRMNIPGTLDNEFWQKGVSACAVCDGALPIFRNKPLAVIGGGDSAMEEASFLSKFGSKVYIIHRRDELRASKAMQTRARQNGKIEFCKEIGRSFDYFVCSLVYSHVVTEARGDALLRSLVVQDLKTKENKEIEASGLFFAIGHIPNTAFLGGQLKTLDDGYLATAPGTTETSVKGVFAAGDVQDKRWRQAITAAGSGCMAALQVEHFLSTLGQD